MRLIDANLNRIREGLRVLEDIARFVLDDAALSEALKKMRHEIAGNNGRLQRQLLVSRKSEDDVGAFLKIQDNTGRNSLLDVTVANARRVEEALRVIEEVAKIPGSGFDSEAFQRTRFSVYQIEQDMVTLLSRKNKRERIKGLCIIINLDILNGQNLREIVEEVIRAGAKVIQLRAEQCSPVKIFKAAQEIAQVCTAHDILFIICGHPDIAAVSGADGVQLQQGDLPLSQAHRILSIDRIIGCTVTSALQAHEADIQGADFLTTDPIFSSLSLREIKPVGLEILHEITEATVLPVIAVGGIDTGNIISVAKTGVSSCAVDVSTVESGSIENTTRELVVKIESISRN